jgi:hypothetical protein
MSLCVLSPAAALAEQKAMEKEQQKNTVLHSGGN